MEPDFGIPGAFLIKNEHKHKFFLQSATLEVPANQSIQFNCKSWIYPFTKTKTNRLFFSNTVSKHIKFGYWQNPFKCNKKPELMLLCLGLSAKRNARNFG